MCLNGYKMYFFVYNNLLHEMILIEYKLLKMCHYYIDVNLYKIIF